MSLIAPISFRSRAYPDVPRLDLGFDKKFQNFEILNFVIFIFRVILTKLGLKVSENPAFGNRLKPLISFNFLKLKADTIKEILMIFANNSDLI